MASSKKFTCGLTVGGRASSRSKHVVPSPDGMKKFVSLDGKRKFDQAYVAYVGKSVSPDDVFAATKSWLKSGARYRSLLESFLTQVHELKLGTVIAIGENSGHHVTLIVVQSQPSAAPGPNLL